MTTTCTGADAVTAQAWETLAWLLSPPVVTITVCLILPITVCLILPIAVMAVWFAWTCKEDR
jgi:hypothetical protein